MHNGDKNEEEEEEESELEEDDENMCELPEGEETNRPQPNHSWTQCNERDIY